MVVPERHHGWTDRAYDRTERWKDSGNTSNCLTIYEGDQIEKGFKSVAYSLTFRSKEKTLEEAEINGTMNKILNGLEGMGIQLRK